MVRIVVTGANGRIGRATCARLRAAGHQVTGFDASGPPGPHHVQVDVADYGQVLDALFGVGDRHDGTDAIVHLASRSAIGLAPDVTVLQENLRIATNVMHGARRGGITTVVFASSLAVLGFPFLEPPPYLPLDDECPKRPNNAYALAKHLEEETAAELARWSPGSRLVGLRFTNVLEPSAYAGFAAHEREPATRRAVLWGYLDVRDAAAAIECALLRAPAGAHNYLIAQRETTMRRTSAELVAEFFPHVPLRGELHNHDALTSIARAERELGFDPRHSWRSGEG